MTKLKVLVGVGRFILGLVFIISSMSKILDRVGTAKALKEFRIPSWAHPVVNAALPPTEILISVLLIFNKTYRFGANIASPLLALFTAVIGMQLRVGNQVRCACFGSLSSESISAKTIARNLILLFVSVLVGNAESRFSNHVRRWRRILERSNNIRLAALISIVIVQMMLIVTLLKRYGEALAAPSEFGPAHEEDGLRQGDALENDLHVEMLTGEQENLSHLVRREDGLHAFMFLSADCTACKGVVEQLSAAHTEAATTRTPVSVVVRDKETALMLFTGADFGRATHIIVDKQSEITRHFRVSRIPYVVELSNELIVATVPLIGTEEITEWLKVN